MKSKSQSKRRRNPGSRPHSESPDRSSEATSAESTAGSADGYPPIRWRLMPLQAPTNSDRIRLGIALALFIGWIVVLVWLVSKTLGN